MTLKEIFAPITHDLDHVKEQITVQLHSLYAGEHLHESQKAHIEKFLRHFFQIFGKGLRPGLVLLSARLTGPIPQEEHHYQSVIKLATAVELLHSASLAHDDVIDRATVRRNQTSLNVQYGDKIAVVVGDMFVLQAFSLLLNLETVAWQQKEKIFQVLTRTVQKMCIGEMCEHQIRTEQRPAQLEEYLTLLENKTATLMSACCECGTILNGKEPADSDKMAEFGRHFGLAFQLADDLKDQDALFQQNGALLAAAQDHITKAKAALNAFDGNPVKGNLIALCDLILPENGNPGIFDQTV